MWVGKMVWELGYPRWLTRLIVLNPKIPEPLPSESRSRSLRQSSRICHMKLWVNFNCIRFYGFIISLQVLVSEIRSTMGKRCLMLRLTSLTLEWKWFKWTPGLGSKKNALNLLSPTLTWDRQWVSLSIPVLQMKGLVTTGKWFSNITHLLSVPTRTRIPSLSKKWSKYGELATRWPMGQIACSSYKILKIKIFHINVFWPLWKNEGIW